MRSTSRLAVDWVKPELEDERWEFFHHPAKQPYYLRHALSWESIRDASASGTLTPWPRGPFLETLPISLAYPDYEDYSTYLARSRRNYRMSYTRMETALQREGHLTLPAPIVLSCNGEGLLFSGWRRLCLAWNYGMVPYAWLVTLRSTVEPTIREGLD